MRFGQQLFNVLFRAPHIGLDHRAYCASMTRHAVQFVHKVERALGVGRAFHVDPNEITRIHGRRLRHQAGDQIAGEFLVHVETHVGKLQADIRVELAARDFVQHLMIKLGAGAGFLSVGNVLAEVVDGNAETRLIDGLSDAQRIVHLGAGHKTAGQTLPDGGPLSHPAQRAVLGKRNEERPQHVPSRPRSVWRAPRTRMKITEICTTAEENLRRTE